MHFRHERQRNFLKEDSERLLPFAGATKPQAGGQRTGYQERVETWLQKLMLEKETPNTQQLRVLQAVKNRVLLEVQLLKGGPELRRKHLPHLFSTQEEEPLRLLIHGLPGTGKKPCHPLDTPTFHGSNGMDSRSAVLMCGFSK